MARSCAWTAKQKSAARAGDIVTLHKLMGRHENDDDDTCKGTPAPLPAARLARITSLLASRTTVRAAIPPAMFGTTTEYETRHRTHEPTEGDPDDATAKLIGDDNADDMGTYITDFMTWYMEWPYIDTAFVAVYNSLPGYGDKIAAGCCG
jgi:hypothetical protein